MSCCLLYNATKYMRSQKSLIRMHLSKVFLQKINVKPSLQKPNSVGALQRITFILILKLSHIIYMKSYQVVSFAGHYVLLVNHMIKQLNLVQDHSLNVHQNNHILTGRGLEARATLQSSTYSERSKCLTLNIFSLSLFSSNVSVES